MIDDWNKIASDLLLGRKIVAVRYMSDKEALAWMIDSKPVIIKLDNGLILTPMSDDEGNNGGALYTNDDHCDCLPTISGGRHG